MNSKICEMLGIEFPLLAFSHCRDVVAAVSKAGGMGVFGAVNLPPDRLKEELDWIDSNVDGMPYGIDLIVPNKFEGKGEKITTEQLVKAIPQGHRDFTKEILFTVIELVYLIYVCAYTQRRPIYGNLQRFGFSRLREAY